MPGPESRGRTGQSPYKPLILPGAGLRPEGQARDERWDHKAQTLLRSVSAIRRTYREGSGFDRWRSDRERARRNHSADGSDAANPRPCAARDRVRRGAHDSETAHEEPGGTQRENPAVPTALVRGRRPDPFPARRTP